MERELILDIIKTVSNTNLAYVEVKNGNLDIKICNGFKGESFKENIEKNKLDDEIKNKKENLTEDRLCETNTVESNSDIVTLASPLVGIFCLSEAPDKPPFCSVGDRICKGDIVGIIEAMKLLNEIKSEWDGEVIEIMAKEDQMVQYGQPLFKIKKINS